MRQRPADITANLGVCGYFGFGNLGDELILESLVRFFRPHLSLRVWAADPQGVAAHHQVLAHPWQELALLVQDPPDGLILAGGLLQEHWPLDPAFVFCPKGGNAIYYPATALLAATQGFPVVFHGVGFGPLHTAWGRKVARAACQVAAKVSVRDETSLQVLAEAGVEIAGIRVSADPVFALPLPTSGVQEERGEKAPWRLGINLCPWNLGVSESFWFPRVAEALRRFLRRQSCELLLLPFHRSANPGENDATILSQLAEHLQNESVSIHWAHPRDFASALAAISSCHALLAMRYHAVALAGLGHVPFVALAYDPKVEALAKQLACPQAALALDHLSPRALSLLLDAAFLGKSAADPEAVKKLQKEARADLGHTLELFQKGQGKAQWGEEALELWAQGTANVLGELARIRGGHKEAEEARLWAEAEREALGRKLSRLEGEHNALLRQYGERQREVERLQAELGRLQEEHSVLVERDGERQREAERLQAELGRLQEEHGVLVEQYGERQREVERLSHTLTSITRTRWFRLISRYWAFRQRLAGKMSAFRAARPTSRPLLPREGSDEKEGERFEKSKGELSGETFKEKDEKSGLRDVCRPEERRRPELFDMLILPIIDWDFRFQRPQQLATQFGRLGHRVFYVAQKTRSSGQAFYLQEKATNVFEVSFKAPQRSVYQETMDEEVLEAYVDALSHMRRALGMGSCALMVELPFWWPLAQRLRSLFGWPIIYDCMDYHAGFSTNKPEMLQQEEALLAGANLVAVSSRYLQAMASKHNPVVFTLPNACDYDHFSLVPFRPCQAPLTIGYYGAIADWFDADLLADLAELRPCWRFLLVGSTYTADTSRLRRLANVELVGEQPYASLPQWLGAMDALVIPFRLTPLIQATNPVKFFEIMAAGKPLVSVPLPEVAEFKSFVAFASTAEEFAHELEKALAEHSPEKAEERRAFARAHTWEKRVEGFYPSLVEAFPLVSVIVVSYNGLSLTRLCLESLLQRTDWPHLEVLVVDNGSQDGTPSYLQSLAARDRRVRVILNGENRGFPAANNQALALARGGFLVLLNNDTVVPYTWLSRLIRHLASKPQAGLVGVVTNWIGNEAQIPVGYQSLEDMPAWAEAYMAAHDGETFPIPVPAMFCLGMRREVFQLLGPLDERFSLGMFEDDDYALRARQAGLEVLCAEDVFVHHHGKASFRQMDPAKYEALFAKNKMLFEEKWQKPWVPHRYRNQ